MSLPALNASGGWNTDAHRASPRRFDIKLARVALPVMEFLRSSRLKVMVIAPGLNVGEDVAHCKASLTKSSGPCPSTC